MIESQKHSSSVLNKKRMYIDRQEVKGNLPYVPGHKSLKLEVDKLKKKYGLHHITISDADVEEEDIDIHSIESDGRTTFSEALGFWLLAVCCNFGLTVILAAALDITENDLSIRDQVDSDLDDNDYLFVRDCNKISTGNFLLISVVPELISQIIATLTPFCAHVRMIVICILYFCGYIIVASSNVKYVLYLGVGCISFATGLAQVTILSCLSLYDNEKLILRYSSGNGFAGLVGSLSYIGLVAWGFSTSTILCLLTTLPFLIGLTFWGILNRTICCCCDEDEDEDAIMRRDSSMTFYRIRKTGDLLNYLSHIRQSYGMNITYLPHLFPYVITSIFVYFFEFYINQCLTELIYFKEFTLSHNEQYRWYHLIYNLAVFTVGSSLNFITVKSLWCLPFLQGVNATFLTLAAIYFFIPHFTFVLGFIFWEGLMSGYTFTTIFYTLYTQVTHDRRKFSMGVVLISESIGSTCAAFISQPTHVFICSLPENMSLWDSNN